MLQPRIFLQISREVLRRHAQNVVIPAHQEGGTWRFIRKELEAWLSRGGPLVAADVDYSPWGKWVALSWFMR